VRQLDDEELDSGDDIGRHDREAQYGEDAEEQVVDEQSTMELEFGKHGIPEPSDGEVCSVRSSPAQGSFKLTVITSSTY
jgi:RNA polymerase-associated protein LEO1